MDAGVGASNVGFSGSAGAVRPGDHRFWRIDFVGHNGYHITPASNENWDVTLGLMYGGVIDTVSGGGTRTTLASIGAGAIWVKNNGMMQATLGVPARLQWMIGRSAGFAVYGNANRVRPYVGVAMFGIPVGYMPW